ncbi:MAG TPA: TatD family hydrolase [Candidatus Paceibacterota bacterium]|nr:TatD family hydrolase [Candidatus Paceibacterota bacterium]
MDRFFDAHTHVHFAAFKDDYREAIARARAAGVRLITVGTQYATSKRAVEMAHEFPDDVWATVGLHPIHTEASFHDEQELGGGAAAQTFTSRGETLDIEAYKKLAADEKVVAIGEFGFDYYHLGPDSKARQRAAFDDQLIVAQAVGKPLMIHCRDAFSDLITALREKKDLLRQPDPGVIHFFTGTVADADALLELGFSFTFGGAVTFPGKKGAPGRYDEVVRHIPLDRLLSETDAPYVAPQTHRGERNEPAYVVEVAEKLAGLKGVPLPEMQTRILDNTARIFGIR